MTSLFEMFNLSDRELKASKCQMFEMRFEKELSLESIESEEMKSREGHKMGSRRLISSFQEGVPF